MKNIKENEGITLVALVITIIILLILAGISISSLTGSGLFAKAKQSKEKSEKTQAEEEIKLVLNEWPMEKLLKDITFEEFLNLKVESKEIDDYKVLENKNIEIYRRKYYLIVDTDGNIIQEIQRMKIIIDNVKVTLRDGTEPEDYSQDIGTKFIVSFDVEIEDGEIVQINPNIPYETDGVERNKTFEIECKIGDVVETKKIKIDFGKKYKIREPEIKSQTTKWTNKDVIVEVDYGSIDETYTKEISIDKGKTYNIYTGPVKIEKNTTVKARIRGKVELESELEISNIDKLEPNDFTPEINDLISPNQLEIRANNITDAEANDEYGSSGIKNYKYYIYQGDDLIASSEIIEDDSWIASGLVVGNTYNIAVEAYDEAGNTKSNSITYTKLPVYAWDSYSTDVTQEYKISEQKLDSFYLARGR